MIFILGTNPRKIRNRAHQTEHFLFINCLKGGSSFSVDFVKVWKKKKKKIEFFVRQTPNHRGFISAWLLIFQFKTNKISRNHTTPEEQVILRLGKLTARFSHMKRDGVVVLREKRVCLLFHLPKIYTVSFHAVNRSSKSPVWVYLHFFGKRTVVFLEAAEVVLAAVDGAIFGGWRIYLKILNLWK